MKLSNKILIGFFGFIFLYLTAAFTEVRFRGTPNTLTDKNSIAETVVLSGVTHVVVNDFGRYISISTSDQPRIEVRSRKGSMLQHLHYQISGDTVKLSHFEPKDERMRITIFVSPETFKAISVNNSSVSVDNATLGSLNIDLNASRVWMNGSNIGSMKADLRESHMDLSGVHLDTLSLTSTNSNVQIYSPVGVLEGSITNSSFLRADQFETIQVKKDKSSSLHVYQ